MTYRVLVVAEGKHFGLSTACLYFNVGGEYGQSGVKSFARGEYQTDFTVSACTCGGYGTVLWYVLYINLLQCCNLGPLTCLRLGHDNSGLVRSLLVEMVFVHCITTGQTYRYSQ